MAISNNYDTLGITCKTKPLVKSRGSEPSLMGERLPSSRTIRPLLPSTLGETVV